MYTFALTGSYKHGGRKKKREVTQTGMTFFPQQYKPTHNVVSYCREGGKEGREKKKEEERGK